MKKVKVHPKRIEAVLACGDDELLFADGYDECIIGIAEPCASSHCLVVYSTDRIVELLRVRDGMSAEDAWEFFEYDIQGSYVGDQTPIFVKAL